MDNTRKKIMLVDDHPTNLTIGKDILRGKYEVFALPSAAKLFEFLTKVRPDLILLDIDMPVMDGFETIKKLKANRDTAEIPVVFLTAKIGEMDELEGLSLGAIDYVTKPFSPPLLLQRIENHLLMQSQKDELKGYKENLARMVQQQTAQIFRLQNSIMSTVAELVEHRDDVTGGHCARTQQFFRLLVEGIIASGLYSDEILNWNTDFLLQSALLHDVGKIIISDIILNKPGKLTPEEYEIMKTHVQKGVEIIERIEKESGGNAFLTHAKVIAGTHHEKWDGTGYPKGLKGSDIPLEGRIMALVDAYDALISARPYKAPLPPAEAERIIMDGTGSHFDPTLVGVFAKLRVEFARVAAQIRGEVL